MEANRKLARRLCLVLGTGVALAAPAFAAAQVGAAPEAERTIRVVGTGEVQATPDEAQVVFAVETFAETARAAGEQNAVVMERVIAALVAAGVPRVSITTTNYSLHPEYVHDEQRQEPRIRGYRASNQVSLRTPELERVGALVDVALGAGANRVDGVSFGLRDAAAAQAEALRRAVADGRAQAEAIAGALGVTLGPVLDASTGAGYAPPVPVVRYRREVMDMAAAAAPTPMQPGQQTVTAQATLVFAIGR